ncbi:MAG TPA: hypothetical protein VIW01_11635 [Dehalococcoidia bacterium]
MEYRHLYAREPRITVPSLLLLAVFVLAAAFIVSAIVWQPWTAGNPSVAAPVSEDTVTDEAAPGDLDVLIQPAAD